MTLIVEWSRPWQWRPGYFKSRIMRRVWWGMVAVAVSTLSPSELVSDRYEWRMHP